MKLKIQLNREKIIGNSTFPIKIFLIKKEGKTFTDFTLAESHTNHNHEDIVENIEVYVCNTFKSAGM